MFARSLWQFVSVSMLIQCAHNIVEGNLRSPGMDGHVPALRK